MDGKYILEAVQGKNGFISVAQDAKKDPAQRAQREMHVFANKRFSAMDQRLPPNCCFLFWEDWGQRLGVQCVFILLTA
jgi:hypothetical protein